MNLKTLIYILSIIETVSLSASMAMGKGSNAAAPEVISIAAGAFTQGSDASEREYGYVLDESGYGHSRTREGKWYSAEIPRKSVKTEAYAITKNLITNAEYAVFVKDTGYQPPAVSEEEWKSYGLAAPFSRVQKFIWTSQKPPINRAKHPVVLVSWSDANAYAKWLTTKTGQLWQLPTEIQWEKAARGTKGNYFPWGNIYSATLLNTYDAGPFDTVPVGSYPGGASPFGMLDAAGQVFEWTRDPARKGRYIVKGGSWDDKGCGVCRPAARHSRPAFLKHILIGFRLVTSAPVKH